MKNLASIFLFALFCVGTIHAQGGATGPLEWKISDGVLIISGEGAMPNYSSINVFPPWYDYYNSISSVRIEEGVTSIGNDAFRGSSIYSVTFASSTLRTIGVEAFQNCLNLTSINIPDMVTHISGYAFYACNGLTSVTIGSGVIAIGNYVFSGCTQLPAIEVATDNPYFISDNGILFNMGKTTLMRYPAGKQGSSYTIPDGVTSIYPDAFDSCSELYSIIIPDGVTAIGDWAFTRCSSLHSVTIPNSVTHIGIEVFTGCEKLSTITIPASLTSIGARAFCSCINLSEFNNFSPEPQLLTDAFLYSNPDGCTLRVPAASIKDYQQAEEWKEFKNIVPLEAEISLDIEEIYLLIGTTRTFSATITGDLDIPYFVTWNSSSPSVATVDHTGTVTAVNTGITEIIASVLDNEFTCIVTVVEQGESTIEGTITNSGAENVRVNLYMKPPESDTKRGIVGGYVLLATTVPNGNGEYSFENLPEGTYQIQVEIEDYEPEATDEISLSENKNLTDVNFTVEEGRIMVDADISTGAEELFASELKAYPNPFTDVLHITGMAIETLYAASLRVINTTGTVVHTQTITNPDDTIHLGHLPAGMYIIRFENGRRATVMKVVKQ